MTVERILAVKGRDVVTMQPHRTIGEASKQLAEKKIGAVVVTGADGRVLGILSERDIVRALASGGGEACRDPISSHMTANVVSASETMSVDAVMEEMTRGRFRHIPVVQDGRLGGIISIGDVVKHRLAEIESDYRALHEYVATA